MSLEKAIQWQDENWVKPAIHLIRESDDTLTSSEICEQLGIDTELRGVIGCLLSNRTEILSWRDEETGKRVYKANTCEIHGYPDKVFPHQAKPVCTCE